MRTGVVSHRKCCNCVIGFIGMHHRWEQIFPGESRTWEWPRLRSLASSVVHELVLDSFSCDPQVGGGVFNLRKGKHQPPIFWERVNLGYLEERRVEMQTMNGEDWRDGSVYNMISGGSVSRPIACRQNFAKIKISRHPFRVWVSPSTEPSCIYCSIISPDYLPREFA
jgi:hypothetical protein